MAQSNLERVGSAMESLRKGSAHSSNARCGPSSEIAGLTQPGRVSGRDVHLP